MPSRHRAPLGTAILILLTACSGATSSDQAHTGPRANSSAMVVLHADQLRSGASNLLIALRSRLSGMQVRTSRSECPEITLRGTSSMFGENSPAVYVDGIRAANTCVLDMLATAEVSRVEVYLMGVAPRPPYKAHPNGLILVFLENGRL